MRRLAASVAVALSVGAAVGCGDEGSAPATAVQQPQSTPDGGSKVPTTTTADTNPTATTGVPKGGGKPPGATPTTTAGSGESGAGGAGDEEPARVPVALTLNGGALSPTTVTIPAFLAVAVTVTSTGGAATKVTIDAPGGGTLSLPAGGGKASKALTGLKPGDYAVTTTPGGGRTVLHVVNGGDPGP